MASPLLELLSPNTQLCFCFVFRPVHRIGLLFRLFTHAWVASALLFGRSNFAPSRPVCVVRWRRCERCPRLPLTLQNMRSGCQIRLIGCCPNNPYCLIKVYLIKGMSLSLHMSVVNPNLLGLSHFDTLVGYHENNTLVLK